MSTLHVRVPAEDRRQQIIEAARNLFSIRGYEGTTTRELAESIGINEAILFRHFPSKQELYWAVLQDMIDTRGTRDRLREHVNAGMSDREMFMAVANDILNRNVQLARLLLYSVLENHELSERFLRTHVLACHETLAEYIQAGIDAGRFREMDPMLAARAFLGMFSYHFQIQELYGGKQIEEFDRDEVITKLVDIWLEGMKPRPSLKTPRTSKARRLRTVEKVTQ